MEFDKLIIRRDSFYEIQHYFLRIIIDLQFKTIIKIFKKELSRLDSGKTFLDVGSGTSPYLRLLKRTKHNYLSLDPYTEADYKDLEDIPKTVEPDVILLKEKISRVSFLDQRSLQCQSS